MHRFFHAWLPLLGLLATPLLTQCSTGIDPALLAERQQQIAAEPTGDFLIGRRYHVEKTRFWGYLRKPRTPWKSAQLVVMNETKGIRVPDRLPEFGPGLTHGYDHNYQYKVYGRFSGEKVYDPNSNQILPEFIPRRFEIINEDPGWLFRPDEKYSPYQLTLYPTM